MFKSSHLLLPVLALSLGACDSKVTECNKLADIVNKGVEAMGKIEGRANQDPAALAKDAKEMAELAKTTTEQIDAIGIKTEELKPKAEKYQTMMQGMADVGQEFATLLDKTKELTGKLEAAEKKFNASQEALQEPCSEESESCTKLAEVLSKQPEGGSEEDMPKLLEQYVSDLEGLDLQDAAVKKAVDEHVVAAKDYKSVVKEMTELDTKLAEAEKKLDEVVAQEDAIVAELNTYCIGSPS